MFKNPDFFEHLCNLLPKILPYIEPAIKERYYPTEFSDYPNLGHNENGFPTISKYPLKIDISQVFRPLYSGQEPAIDLKNSPDFIWLFNEIKSNPDLKDYFRLPNKDAELDKSYDFFVANFIEGFIERYYYLHGVKFSRTKFEKIYKSVENYMYSETLHFDIAVPILFVKFEVDTFKISNNVVIRKISDENNRARHRITAYSPAIVDSLYMSATHEIVLRNYSYKRQSSLYDYFHFSDPFLYPLNIIERFFTILKLVTDYTSGFAQILVYPSNWCDSYYADVEPVKGAITKSYPHHFENFYWTRKSYTKLTLKELQEIKKLFNKADLSPDNKVDISLKRFYKSMMRQEEEDIIIDLIIALELLLSDGEKSDITYKLSMRLTALIRKYKNSEYHAEEVFNNIKKIYDYRSAVVHGADKRAQKSREIKNPDNSTIPTIELAKRYLREILKIVILHPQHLEAKTNDLLLLRS
jgi:hypothetical protein